MSDLKTLREKKQAYDALIEAEGKTVLKSAFDEFFEKNPRVRGIRWDQYTPSFNDGDPCTFGVHEFRYLVAESDAEADAADYEYGYELSETDLPRVVQREFEGQFSDMEDLFHAVFGDGFEVTVTRNGFATTYCDHD